MRHPRPLRFATQRGFTIIESIIALVILAIASVAIVSLQSDIFSGQSDNKSMEVGVQLMQECAEKILGVRRGAGYGGVMSSTCDGLGNINGFGAPSIALNDASGTAITTCASSTCTATISIRKGTTTLTPITLRLVNY